MTMSWRWEAAAATYDQEKPKIAAATRNAPSVADQAFKYTGDCDPPPSTAGPYLQRPDDPAVTEPPGRWSRRSGQKRSWPNDLWCLSSH
jgi:hypothetical protein